MPKSAGRCMSPGPSGKVPRWTNFCVKPSSEIGFGITVLATLRRTSARVALPFAQDLSIARASTWAAA